VFAALHGKRRKTRSGGRSPGRESPG
jgi:hypothetical protein